MKQNKLPLTFSYLEIVNIKKDISHDKNIVYYLSCDVCKTNYNVRREPCKFLTRLL